MNGASNEPGPVGSTGAAPDPEPSAERVLARLELPDAASEVLAIVRFLTAPDGPLQRPAADGTSSPWQERVLLKAQERVAVIDHFLRGRVAFFAAARQHGYMVVDAELDVAGAALDATRAVAVVVDALLAGGLPTERQFDRMGEATNKIFAALDRL